MSRRHMILGFGAAALVATGVLGSSSHGSRRARDARAGAGDRRGAAPHLETAVVAGGCFWGVQGVFQHVKGVTQALSGYSGGSAANAHYRSCRHRRDRPCGIGADHVRSARRELWQDFADLFFGRDRPDRIEPSGPGRRHAISLVDFRRQRRDRGRSRKPISRSSTRHMSSTRRIVTRVDPFRGFYPAEGYHQDFATLHPDNGYIAENDLPKIENLRQLFPALYRPQRSWWARPE